MSIDSDHLSPDKLAFQSRLAVLQQHRDDLLKIALQFLHRGPLRMRTGETGDVTDEKPRPGSRGTTVFFVHPKTTDKAAFGYLIEVVQEGSDGGHNSGGH